MLIEFLVSKFFFLVTAGAGVVLFVLAVMYANKSIGVKISEHVLPKIMESPEAAADYFKGRLYAIAAVICAALLAGAII